MDIVIETMGGYDPTFELIKKALFNKKRMVTANKALIAERVTSCLDLRKIMASS